jgi:hypothetical protein
MAPRINWRKFEINSTYRDNFFPEIDFGSINSIEKKQLICEAVLNSSVKFSDKLELSSKYKRLSSHLEIDDKANSIRIIEELLLLVSLNSGIENDEYRFLALLKNSL